MKMRMRIIKIFRQSQSKKSCNLFSILKGMNEKIKKSYNLEETNPQQSYQRRSQDFDKHLTWRILQKKLTVKSQTSFYMRATLAFNELTIIVKPELCRGPVYASAYHLN